ncbi:MAG TPA: glycosyltransferase, partial [Candidatus Obscuribacterales bacterium]
MRIVLVTRAFPPDTGEAPFPASYELARGLKACGHELLVLTFTDGESREETVDGIRVWRQKFDFQHYRSMQLPLASAHCLAQALDLYTATESLVGDFHPDVIESQEFNGLGLFWALERKYPFVVRCYGPLSHLLKGSLVGSFPPVDAELVNIMEIAPIGEADGLITICQDMAARMSDWS